MWRFKANQHPSFPGIAHSTENGLINHTVGGEEDTTKKEGFLYEARLFLFFHWLCLECSLKLKKEKHMIETSYFKITKVIIYRHFKKQIMFRVC